MEDFFLASAEGPELNHLTSILVKMWAFGSCFWASSVVLLPSFHPPLSPDLQLGRQGAILRAPPLLSAARGPHPATKTLAFPMNAPSSQHSRALPRGRGAALAPVL